MNNSTVSTPTLSLDETEDDDRESYESNHLQYAIISILVINVLIAVVSFLFNFVLVLTFVKRSSLRTPSHFLLLCLALSDFFGAAVMEPLFCTFLISLLTAEDSLYEILDRVGVQLAIFHGFIAFSTVTLIITDRFLAVHLHLRYNQLITIQRYAIVFTIIAIVFAVLNVTDVLLDSEHFTYVDFVLVLMGLIMSYVLIFKIFRIVRRHSAQIQAQQQATQSDIDMPRYKRSVNTMYLIIAAFLLCYGVKLLNLAYDSELLALACYTVSMMGGVLHPLIYFWRIQEMRNAILTIIR